MKFIRLLGKVYLALLFTGLICLLSFAPIIIGSTTGEFIWIIVEFFTLPLAIALLIFSLYK